MKNKVYCEDCKYLREPAPMRVAFLGKEKSPYLCAYTIKIHNTPVRKCIQMDKCEEKNANNDCPDFKKLGPIGRVFGRCDYN